MFYPGSDIFTSKIDNVSSHFTKISCRKRSARSDYLYIFFMKTYFFVAIFSSNTVNIGYPVELDKKTTTFIKVHIHD
jgi:hypothetical protein